MEDLNELENIFTIFYMNSRAFASALEENNFKNEDETQCVQWIDVNVNVRVLSPH